MKSAIYICKVSPPYLTLEFQEDTCKTVCQMKGIQNIEVIQDIEQDKPNLKNLLESEYDCIIIYSLICLGSTLSEIINCIKKILDNDKKLISITDPINLNDFGKDTTENLLLSVAIGSVIKTNKIWEEILEFKSQF